VPGYGEWIQNLDRRGHRLNTLVALPVKDPFHLARALIYSVGVLEQLAKS
jgi:N-acylglucosamine 2-epimerase